MAHQKKILTISIAAYNVENYLEETLQSCIIEDDGLDVIIIDDGSLDKTKEISEKFVREYPEIFRYFYKENGGYGSTINFSLKEAKGKYFKLLDGDDSFSTEMLKSFINNLRDSKSDLVITDYLMVYNDLRKSKETIHNRILPQKEYLLKDVEENVIFSMPCLCHKTELLHKLNFKITENCFYTDTEFIVLTMPYISTIIYYDIIIYKYRVGVEGQSISLAGRRKYVGDAEKVLKKLLKEVDINIASKTIIFQISQLAKFVTNCNLCLLPSKENRNKVILFELFLKDNYPIIYKNMANKTIGILRLSNYKLYYLSHYIICKQISR